MRFVRANPHEYLVVGHNGHIVNHGTASCAFIWPGSTWTLIPSTKQETSFEMTQETRDGIPMRFKGIIIYHIGDPEAAARAFDFGDGRGPGQIQTFLGHICLGELRALVAQMTMDECIHQRKTTLTGAVFRALDQVIKGKDSTGMGVQYSWGIEIDVVQVSQVFIVDVELRKQLEAEVRSQIRSDSQLVEIAAQEKLQVAEVARQRRTRQGELDTRRLRTEVDRETLRLDMQLELDRAETEVPVLISKLQKRKQMLTEELEVKRLEAELGRLESECAMIRPTAEQKLRREMSA